MIKKHYSKIGLFMFLSVVLLFTSSASATGVNPEVSRVEYFTIQNNNSCGTAGPTLFYKANFAFNVTNISDIPTTVTVKLFKKDGSEFTEVGNEFTPGVPVEISPNSTVQYLASFGQESQTKLFLECSERPTYGKVIVHSNYGLILAGGETTSSRQLSSATPSHYELYFNSPILVNTGKPF